MMNWSATPKSTTLHWIIASFISNGTTAISQIVDWYFISSVWNGGHPVTIIPSHSFNQRILSDFLRFFPSHLPTPTPPRTINYAHLAPSPQRRCARQGVSSSSTSSSASATAVVVVAPSGVKCKIPINITGPTSQVGIGGYELHREGV